MDSCQKNSTRTSRRNSKNLLQDLFYRGIHGGGRDTPVSCMFLSHVWLSALPLLSLLSLILLRIIIINCASLWTLWFSFPNHFPNRSQLSLVEMREWFTPLPVWSERKANSSFLRILILWKSTRSAIYHCYYSGRWFWFAASDLLKVENSVSCRFKFVFHPYFFYILQPKPTNETS